MATNHNLRTISKLVLLNLNHNKALEIALSKLQPHLTGADESMNKETFLQKFVSTQSSALFQLMGHILKWYFIFYVSYEHNIFVRDWCNTIGLLSAPWILKVLSTNTTVLSMRPCISMCFRFKCWYCKYHLGDVISPTLRWQQLHDNK